MPNDGVNYKLDWQLICEAIADNGRLLQQILVELQRLNARFNSPVLDDAELTTGVTDENSTNTN